MPSRYEAFVDNKPEWISDKHFTQQRLAGPNPMSLKRVTVHGQGTSLPTRPVVALKKCIFKSLLKINGTRRLAFNTLKLYKERIRTSY